MLLRPVNEITVEMNMNSYSADFSFRRKQKHLCFKFIYASRH